MKSEPPRAADESLSPDEIGRVAADWLILRERGLNAAQQAAFEMWLLADQRHATIYSETEESWNMLDRLKTGSGQRSLYPKRRHGYAWALAGLAAAGLLLLGVGKWHGPRSFTESDTTAAGVSRTIDLPDGSIVRLGSESEVAIRLTAAQRDVRLVRGEAYFKVAKNPERPFVVTIGRVAVRAVGTEFMINYHAQAVEVQVTEGKVRVNDADNGNSLLAAPAPGEMPLLVAGQRVVIGASETAAVPESALAAIGPTEQRLEFISVPLAEIVAEFNRHNLRRLVITDPKLGARRFGGTFFSGDEETFVRMLEANFPVTVERRTDETVLSLAR